MPDPVEPSLYPHPVETAPVSRGARRLLVRLFGGFRPAYLPVLITYFAYGASAITGVALVFFEKDTLGLTPAEVAGIGFWVGLPWSMKMVVGVASDVYPILGSRRKPYLILGALCSMTAYAFLATAVHTKGAFLLAMVAVAVGFMIQDVVADALSVEIAESGQEIGQIQALGRMALLVGGISVGYLSGVLAARVGPGGVFALAMALPALVLLSALFVRPGPRKPVPASRAETREAQERDETRGAGPLAGGKARLVMVVGLSYAALGVLLETLDVPLAQEIILLVSAGLIGLLLQRVGISRGVAVAAFVIFLFRAVPGVGQGYTFWAIDRLAFDQRFLGLLAQVSSVLSLVGLIAFRKPIIQRPVSFTLVWLITAGTVLYLPTIGLFYGVHEWLGVSARTFAFIDTTISAPLGQLSMVPMLILIARNAPKGAEATMFAIMASLMNLALSASELFTRYLNTVFAVTQQDYSSLGRLMIAVGLIGLLPLLALPALRREEAQPGPAVAPSRAPA
jgi:MFS family permease